jgi:hypothetical protein
MLLQLIAVEKYIQSSITYDQMGPYSKTVNG